MRKRKILIVGDSHTDALKRALRGFKSDHVEIAAYRYAQEKDGRTIGDLDNARIIEMVSALGPDDLVVSTIGGNQHQVVSLMRHPVPFDFHMKGDDGVGMVVPGQVIPYAQMWDFFDTGVRARDGARVEELVRHARCRVVHVVPPPPKADVDHIMRHHEAFFAKSGILDKGVSPAPFRRQVWQLQVRVLEKVGPDWGVTMLKPPVLAVTEDGYLARSYYADDATHGNVEYGALVLAQLVELAEGASHV